ncbi:MAG: hypothetical protein FWF35_00900 [Elusimicrobia bacterium]|nr:hypothetical protein [Elusimicrobiota bacterium]
MNLKNKKGQTTVEYIITTAMLFFLLLGFYISYSRIVPLQFEQGAKLILTVYDAK